MQISTNLNAFTDKTLILVTSRQDAVAYIAYDRDIDKLFEIHTNKPAYTDNEGHFKRSGDGRDYGSGSTEKEIDSISYEEFQSDLNETIAEHDLDDVESIILFAPEQYKNSTPASLPQSLADKISAVHVGNLTDEHPTNILKRLQ